VSDLKSLLEAEAELSSIFSKKNGHNNCYGSYGQGDINALWSPDKNSSVSTMTGNSEQFSITSGQEVPPTVGFSKFGQFKAPIKRPKCNPIVKDERFKKMFSNEDQQNAYF
jgi:hypothetical protein